ncbi:unnamed protein product, partial [Callosobruchus maculatus]
QERPGFSGNSRVGQILWAGPPDLPVVSRHGVKSMSSFSYDDFNAIESMFTKLKRKKVGIHTHNRERTKCGEYHHLFQSLKNDNQRFFQYTRMT